MKQKISYEQQINLLEKELNLKANEITKFTKINHEQNQQIEKFSLMIKELSEKNSEINSELFSLKLEKDNLLCSNETKEQQIQKLQEEIIKRTQITDHVSQVFHELGESKNQVEELKIEIQTLKNQLSHSDIERQKLIDEVKMKNTNQIIYIKNDEASNVLQNYQIYLEKCDQEKKQLQRQIQQFQLHDDKIKIEYQRRVDKLQQALKNSDEKRKNLEEQLLIFKGRLDILQKESEDQITAQKQYEEQRSGQEKEIKQQIEQKDKIITHQQEQINVLEQRLKSSNSFVLDTINMVIPKHLDDSLEIKKQLLLKEAEAKNLKDQLKELQKQNKSLQSQIDKDLPFVVQRKHEYEQMMSICQQQKDKLQSELHLNYKMREEQEKLRSELSSLKIKEQIQSAEIERLRIDNVACREYVTSMQSSDVQMYLKQLSEENLNLKSKIEQMQIVGIYNQQVYHAPAKQIEHLQQENMGLKMTINGKDEEILTLQGKITILEKENELNNTVKQNIQPIVHKIEKIKIRSQKQSQFQLDFRNLRQEKSRLQFRIDELEFEIQKLEGQVQFERQSKEFLEKNLLRLKEEYTRAKDNFKKKQEEFEIKVQEIYSEVKAKVLTKEQINYYQQNQLLYKQQQEDAKLIKDLHQTINQLNQQGQSLREEIFIKNNTIKELEGNGQQNGESEQILKMKVQIDNDKINIQNLNERIQQLGHELEKLQKQLQTYVNDENIRESLQQFSKNIINENRADLNNLEEITHLKRALENNTKRLEEQDKKYLQALEDYRRKFEVRIQEGNDAIQQLVRENQELLNTLEQYKQYYYQEKQDKESKCDLSLGEMNDIQIKLDIVTKERDHLLKKKELCEQKEQQNLMFEESLRQQERSLEEQKQNFEKDSLKKQQEIGEGLLMQKNKELSIITNDYILIREIEDYKNKLIQEQNKTNEHIIQQQGQGNDQNLEKDMIITAKQELENQLNELQQQIEEKKAELLKLNIDQRMQVEEQPNFDEERNQLIEQIAQLNKFKEDITLTDIKLVKEIIQNGKLIAYLEKAKQLHESQTNGQEQQ